jgi:hypothetical protein
LRFPDISLLFSENRENNRDNNREAFYFACRFGRASSDLTWLSVRCGVNRTRILRADAGNSSYETANCREALIIIDWSLTDWAMAPLIKFLAHRPPLVKRGRSNAEVNNTQARSP